MTPQTEAGRMLLRTLIAAIEAEAAQQALTEAVPAVREVAIDRAIADERARIRAAVEGLVDRYGLVDRAAVLAAIDGEAT